MTLSEKFNIDDIGSLIIENKSIKLKNKDKKNIIDAVNGNIKNFIVESYDVNIDMLNIGKNVTSITFPSNCYEICNFIVESCDELGYKIFSNIGKDYINIKVHRNEI